MPHYGALLGSPLLIYGVRQGLNTTFGWSIARQQSHVNRLQKQRDEKITQLKKATRYDSTQELLQKYGGAPPKPKEEESKQGTKWKVKEPQQPQIPVQRTGLPPPPTANIQQRSPTTQPQERPSTPRDRSLPQTPQHMASSPMAVEEPGFAPNAFSQAPPSRQVHDGTSHWYDRILDVMLGEDETLAKNRLVLLCQNCRQVNGQAPPGVKTLEELGRWKCQTCHAWNGSQAEATKIIQDMTQQVPSTPASPTNDVHEAGEEHESVLAEYEGTTGRDSDESDSGVSRRKTRSAGKAEIDGL